MIKLNLNTQNEAEKRILDYLQENADEVLADKINHGVKIQKDGLTLINMKALSDFMDYAQKQAKEAAGKGAKYACIDDAVVYGWAIHYFGEDDIQGVLYNLDGTEYKPIVKQPERKIEKPVSQQTPTKKPSEERLSFFDMIDGQTDTEEEPEPTVEVKEEETIEPTVVSDNTQKQISPLYQKYMEYQNQYPEAVIALRLGDFYEVFGEFAKAVAAELDLTLTRRDCGLEQRVPMVGFPYHVADNYFAKITQKHDVVIVEPDNELRVIKKKNTQPKIENKNDELLGIISKIFGSSLEVRI